MAVTFKRIFRAIRSVCIPIATVTGFSFLLTWIFILYQPSIGPGSVQKLGWQSWDVIGNSDYNNTAASSNSSNGSETDGDNQEWWNSPQKEEKIDYSSLPLDVWAPLLPHSTGLSEIAVAHCFINPEINEDLCSPDSTKEQDALKGKWVRVPRNLNLEANFMSGRLYLYYRRTRRQDIPLITDIQLLSKDAKPESDGWHKATTSLRTGTRAPSLFLWYHLGKTTAEMSQAENADLITELDVLYGKDVPWYGFQKLEPPTILGTFENEGTWLTYRRGVKVPPKAPPLHFSHSGNFKILQVADLHYSVSQGICRETDHPCSNSDNLTSNLLSRVLSMEEPDLVVFSGDQLNGQGTSWDPKSVLAKFAKSVTDKGIPWAAVFGNHDMDDGLRKEEQVLLMRSLPYSLVQRGPKDIHGVGNYVLKVSSADASKTHLLTLYFLDSGSYSRGFRDWFGFFYPTEYDWIRQSQIDWFLQESASVHSIERPFRPDENNDVGHVWKEQREQITPNTKRLAKPNALMFFHIPLQESYHDADIDSETGKNLDVGISGQEKPGNAVKSDGFFEKGLLNAFESGHVSQGNKLEVKVVANGHCHLTENCRRVKGIWLCFAGGGSYSGYGKIGFDRRFRVFEISEYGETIRTHKRTEHGEIIDDMVLARDGAAPFNL